MKTELIKIRDVAIECYVTSHETLIPIEPFCNLLGIDYSIQLECIKEDLMLFKLYRPAYITGSDGKSYEIGCLPIQFFFGWIYSIHPKNIDIQQDLIARKIDFCNILYDYFFTRTNFIIEKQRLIISQQDIVFEAQDKLFFEKQKLSGFKSMNFDEWKLERDQLSLFTEEN